MSGWWFWYVLIVLMMTSMLGGVLQVGAPRKPKSAAMAAGDVLINTLLILGIAYYGFMR